jgi:hypothetical protein
MAITPALIIISPATYPWSISFMGCSTLASLALVLLTALFGAAEPRLMIPASLVVGEVYLYITGTWYPLDILLVLVPIVTMYALLAPQYRELRVVSR